jgi:uncharacterized protein YjbJ (UPF0337 family)
MGARIDKATGRVKEAAGVLTGNKDLRRRGKADQVAADAALTIDRGASTARKALGDSSSAAGRLLEQGRAGADKAIDQATAALHKVLKNK